MSMSDFASFENRIVPKVTEWPPSPKLMSDFPKLHANGSD